MRDLSVKWLSAVGTEIEVELVESDDPSGVEPAVRVRSAALLKRTVRADDDEEGYLYAEDLARIQQAAAKLRELLDAESGAEDGE